MDYSGEFVADVLIINRPSYLEQKVDIAMRIWPIGNVKTFRKNVKHNDNALYTSYVVIPQW